ncbi:hypothetical protein L6452_19687 [Arctium lappa]|uniref:Uncharacterized protein n=1 Tax=Arctium lappa TaxID=4217 RepID=A0ACB9BB35_ARCLA|nr:hypothetical protein L6452_19687 [Arctium lappa]
MAAPADQGPPPLPHRRPRVRETLQSLDTPFQHAKSETFSMQRKQRPLKLFKENGYGEQIVKSTSLKTFKPYRPDTPTTATCGA